MHCNDAPAQPWQKGFHSVEAVEMFDVKTHMGFRPCELVHVFLSLPLGALR